MRKSYIFIYSDSMGTREQVKSYLNQITIILDWRYELPNTFYLISEHSANEIVAEIRRITGNSLFLVTEYSHQNSQGWLSNETWYLLNNARRKPTI